MRFSFTIEGQSSDSFVETNSRLHESLVRFIKEFEQVRIVKLEIEDDKTTKDKQADGLAVVSLGGAERAKNWTVELQLEAASWFFNAVGETSYSKVRDMYGISKTLCYRLNHGERIGRKSILAIIGVLEQLNPQTEASEHAIKKFKKML